MSKEEGIKEWWTASNKEMWPEMFSESEVPNFMFIWILQPWITNRERAMSKI
jgi:hypothetical protein